MGDREAHIPSVSEEVVGVVNVTTLNSRQYCVILDPVGPNGKPQLGKKKVVKVRRSSAHPPCCLGFLRCFPPLSGFIASVFLCQGECSFFLQPGEQLERGIQDVFVLSEEEGLVLRAVEAFNDSEQVSRNIWTPVGFHGNAMCSGFLTGAVNVALASLAFTIRPQVE